MARYYCQHITRDKPKVKMYMINSSIVSAQNRVRMYITDFEFDIPDDKGIKLKDIIECGCVDREKSYCLDANYWKGGNSTNLLREVTQTVGIQRWLSASWCS